jgi:hypothetical protein
VYGNLKDRFTTILDFAYQDFCAPRNDFMTQELSERLSDAHENEREREQHESFEFSCHQRCSWSSPNRLVSSRRQICRCFWLSARYSIPSLDCKEVLSLVLSINHHHCSGTPSVNAAQHYEVYQICGVASRVNVTFRTNEEFGARSTTGIYSNKYLFLVTLSPCVRIYGMLYL